MIQTPPAPQTSASATHPGPRRAGWRCAVVLAGILGLFFALWVHGQEEAPAPAPGNGSQPPSTADLTGSTGTLSSSEDKLSWLADLHQQIEEKRKRLRKIERQIKKTTQETERQEALARLAEIEAALGTLRSQFQDIALGGVDLSDLGTGPKETEFHWEKELTEIVRPLFDSLRDLTEKPRAIERLRSQIVDGEADLKLLESALAHLEEIRELNQDADVKKRLAEIARTWQERQRDLRQEIEVLRFQLASLRGQQQSYWQSTSAFLEQFFQGRGLTLLLAIATAVGVWFTFHAFRRLIVRRAAVDDLRIRRPWARVLWFAYRGFLILLVIITFLSGLYFSNDWLLLGLALILLVAAAISLKSALPGFIEEMRLLLNVGPVREGERVIYQGLPWRVRSINVYCMLHNYLLGWLLTLGILLLVIYARRSWAIP